MKFKLSETVEHGGAWHGPGSVLDLTEDQVAAFAGKGRALDGSEKPPAKAGTGRVKG